MLAQPSIATNGIVNATGYQTTLAPDTVFVIFGSALGPATLTAATAPNYPDTLGGTSITFTTSSGGAPITAKMIYSSATQVAGLLPSSLTPGTYAVKLTYNSQPSAPQNVTVVARSFGIATSNSAGTGAAQATIGSVNNGLSLVRLTSGQLAFGGFNWTSWTSPIPRTLAFWGTGRRRRCRERHRRHLRRPDSRRKLQRDCRRHSDYTCLCLLASSGYPGLWQINFTLPATIAPDCFASVQVSAGGQLSNGVTIAIAAAGQTCSSQVPHVLLFPNSTAEAARL